MNLFHQAGKKEALPTSLKQLSVLYVEDNADVRNQLLQFLQRRFGQVLVAEDGAQGLQLYTHQETPPDLVISDIRMPRMDGLSLAEHLRELDPEQPIVMTTAHEETEYLLRAIDLGIDKFILKPVDTKQLHETLVRIADQLQARKELNSALQALQSSEVRYRTLFWNAMDALCIFDWESLEIIEINRQLQQVFGYSFRELQGANLTRLFAEPKFAKVRDLIYQAEHQREVFLANLCSSAEQPFPAEFMVTRFNAGSKDLGLITCRDASERLQSMQEQQALVEALEMTVDALEEMVSPATQ